MKCFNVREHLDKVRKSILELDEIRKNFEWGW